MPASDFDAIFAHAHVAADDGIRRPGELLLHVDDIFLVHRLARFLVLFLREFDHQLRVLVGSDRAVGLQHGEQSGIDARMHRATGHHGRRYDFALGSLIGGLRRRPYRNGDRPRNHQPTP